MSKWIGALLATVIGELLLMVLERPVRESVSGEALRAEVVAGPWAPYPENGVLVAPGSHGTVSLSDNNNVFAKMEITNPGRTPAKDVQLRFGNEPDIYIPMREGAKAKFIENAKDIELRR